MSEDGEKIDIRLYRLDYVQDLSDEEQLAIRLSHVERVKQGKDVWNAWSDMLLLEIEKTYPKNASDVEKLGVLNQYQIDFSELEFQFGLNLSDVKFFLQTSFESCNFINKSIFRGTEFRGGVNFDFSNFHEKALFNKVKIYEYSSFMHTTFHENVSFENSKFGGNDLLDFGRTTFKKEADFSKSEFNVIPFFEEVTFNDSAVFVSAKFLKGTVFKGTVFKEIKSSKIDFSCCVFDDITRFEGNEFESQVNFSDAEFNESVKFTKCDFFGFPSDLRQTIFKHTPIVDNFSSDVKKFISMDKSDINIHECESMFRVLKQLAEQNNNHQKSLEFYGCELYCQRKATGGISNVRNWASGLYGLFSGYGLSLLRPFLLWLGVLFCCVPLQGFNDSKLSELLPKTNWERVAYYAAPSIPIFIGKPLYQKEVRHRLYGHKVDDKKDSEIVARLPTWNRVIRMAQTLLSYIALFLFVLALRNRFKIG